ncbi:hypothetical protein HG15A2_14420 [Adhaeretor mobilis]|uniref:Uncharacterized protein n=1 Tax=Adhaeretor mobilis TaxID=1930276 RepID=A0A517MTF6_9BACT|nr:hypothetical protein HG15A2_14420 [Adhaeretor mobilis]
MLEYATARGVQEVFVASETPLPHWQLHPKATPRNTTARCATYAPQSCIGGSVLALEKGQASAKTPCFTEYRRGDLNPHEVALTGF